MPRPLSAQKKIDMLALLFVAAIAVIFDVFGSLAVGIVAELIIGGVDYADYGVLTSIACALLLLPLWFWLALGVRRFIGWPKGAFEASPRPEGARQGAILIKGSTL